MFTPQSTALPAAFRRRWRLAGACLVFLCIGVSGSSCSTDPIVIEVPDALVESGLAPKMLKAYTTEIDPPVAFVLTGSSTASRKDRLRPDVIISESPSSATAAATSAGADKDADARSADVAPSARFYSRAILVGASGDVAGAAGARPAEALARIALSGEAFYAPPRTAPLAQIESLLWKGSGVKPQGDWYLRAPESHADVEAQTLAVVRDKTGYAIVHASSIESESDEAIVISYTHPSLAIAYDARPAAASGTSDRASADSFVTWLSSAKGKRFVESFGGRVLGARLYAFSLSRVGIATDLPNQQPAASGESFGEHDPERVETPTIKGERTPRRDLK